MQVAERDKTALQGRAAFAACERFAAGKTSAQEWLCHSEHFNPEGRSGPTGREVHKKGHDVSRVLFCGDPAEIRTPDTLLKRQVLCRLSYWVIFKMAGMAGLEPASEGVKVPCLTTWLHPYLAREKWRGPEPKLRPFRLVWGG